jgi:outer membrane receptor protein involved in Fe transport
MSLCRLFCTGCLIVLFVASGFAGSTGKIAGVVTDSRTKEPIPGVNIVVQGTSLGGATNVDGQYVVLNVPPGRYKVVASYIGYKRFEINDLSVSVDFTTPLNIQLIEGSVELDAVVVQADRSPLIRQDLTNPVASISSENIEALPVTDISQVIGLQAGVTVGDDGVIHIRGGLGNEVAYTINGINVNNPYGNARAVGVATNAVREVSLSSGTFSAEYGKALSGVVNYVTKEGTARWSGSARYYTGDLLSSGKYDFGNTITFGENTIGPVRTLFPNIGTFNWTNVNRTEATLSGPILGDDLTFFASGVYNWFGGSIYGQRLYLPTDSYLSREGFPTGDPRRGSSTSAYYFGPVAHDATDLVGLPGGDGATVSLNWSRSYNLQGNLSYRLAPEMKLKYEALYSFDEAPDVTTRAVRYKPDGNALNRGEGMFHSLEFTHSVNDRMFYTVKGSYIVDKRHSWAYDDPYDPRYLPTFYERTIPNTAFLTGGTDNDRFSRKTTTMAGKVDLVAQLFGNHEVKAGVEFRAHTLSVESYTLLFKDPNDPTADPSFSNMLVKGNVFKPVIPTAEGGYIYYERKPTEFATYIQDKIELFKSIILNLGLRYEYFDAAAKFNPYISEELVLQDTIFLNKNLADAGVKHMFSPRISVSYPVTDQGTIRFSYGHFYQIASLSSLYTNPNFRAPRGTPTFGNADVNPQKSVQYEIGLQQGLAEDLKVDLTGYYKDVRDYIYSQQIITPRGDVKYYLLTNLSYANTRGISLSFLKRRSVDGLLSASIDYTFQVSEGNRTEPADEIFYNEQGGKLSETYLVPMGFDRSHTLTTTIALTRPNDWAASIVGYLRTGTPYWPQLPSEVSTVTFVQNSDRQPVQWNVDLKIEKFFEFEGFNWSVFLQVDNLFDVVNELTVYQSSGRSLYNLEPTLSPETLADFGKRIARGDPGMPGAEAFYDYYANNANVSRPRLVRIGASMNF